MVTVVIPFAGAEGKTRLHASRRVRGALARAMLQDVLAACVAVGRVRVVTPDEEGAAAAVEAGAEVVADPGGGQGAAVQAGLESLDPDGILVVNADVPCVVPARPSLAAGRDARRLPGARRGARRNDERAQSPSGRGVRPAVRPEQRDRFRAHAASLGMEAVSVAVPNLADDVDTMEDLTRLQLRAGPRTQACLAELERSSA